MSDEPKSVRLDVESTLTIKAWNDEQFRLQLLADPKAMIEQEIGKPLPAGLKVVIHEETGDTLHFVLPAKPSGDELSAEELSQLAGGAVVGSDVEGEPTEADGRCRRGCRVACRRTCRYYCRRACRRGCRRATE